ncbi:translation initiation factor IF-2-like [Triplophysa rosa]|nr:translation initiation factor IF-2-like [Triplophysa rosa]
MSETSPLTCRLSKQAMLRIRREVRTLLKSLKRKVTMHQIGVKQAKEGRLIPKVVLRRCREEAKKGIPRLLDQLEKDSNQKTQFMLYGYLTAFFASIYGHRCGVFQNLTIQEVEQATRSSSTSAFLINVALHKTNQAFGPAQLSLTCEEYGWFRHLLRLRDGLVGGPSARYFFYTSTPNPCKNLNNYFQGAWVSMGLPGKPTFTDIRTSIATHAKNSHGTDSRQKVAQFMCHDTSTADKFYAVNLNARQAVEHRRLFEEALEGVEASPTRADDTLAARKRPIKRKGKMSGLERSKKQRAESPCFSLTPGSTSSEEAETVPYQESGVSALESEESLAEFPSALAQSSPASSCPGPTSPESESPAEAASPEPASSESASSDAEPATPEPSFSEPTAAPEPSLSEPTAVPEPSFSDSTAVPEPSSSELTATPVPSFSEPTAAPEPSFSEPTAVPERSFSDSTAVPEPSSSELTATPEPSFSATPVRKLNASKQAKLRLGVRTSALKRRRAVVFLSPLKIPPSLRKRLLNPRKSPHRVSKSYRLSGLANANLTRKVVKATLEGRKGK